jgi:hypothetical protein
MSTAVATERMAGASPRQLARIAGGLSFVNIVLGFVALGLVPAVIGGSGNTAATVHNIQANELLYRLSLAAHIVVTVTNVGLAVISYELYKVVNRRLAMLEVFLILVATAVEAAAILGDFVPLALLDGARSSGAFTPDQLQTLVSMPMKLAADSYTIYTVFYGLDFLIPSTILIWNATFLPRAFGPLMAIDGLAYLTNAFASIIAPAFAAHLVPYILLPILVAEGSLCLWYLIVGVDERRWAQRADAARRRESTHLGFLA